MNYRLIAKISKSLLLARVRQTLVAAIGVTFSITMFVALLGFMTGLNDMLDGLVLNRTPHVRLYNEIRPSAQQPADLSADFKDRYNFIHSIKSLNSRQEIYNSGMIMQALHADRRVVGIAPKVTAQVFFTDGNTEITGIMNGIDAAEEGRLFNFADYITSGSYMDLKEVANSVILGKPLAEKLFVETGDVVQVITAKGERFSLRVVGYFQSGIQDFDKTQSFASLETTQKILGRTDGYLTDIQVKLKDVDMAPGVAKEYAGIFKADAEDIQTANAQFETGTFIRTLISYAVGITLLIVAGFGIYNILNMMIYEKMDSIAILKATGFSGKDVNRVFLTIALGIGLFGGILGLLFGFLLSYGIDQVPFETTALPTIKTYPVNYDASIYVIGATFSLLTTYFAGLFPARKASRVDPVIIIRGK